MKYFIERCASFPLFALVFLRLDRRIHETLWLSQRETRWWMKYQVTCTLRFTAFVIILSVVHSIDAKADNKIQPPQTLSLKDAQNIALKNHPEILSSQYNVMGAEEKIKEVNANYLPQITGNSIATFAPSNTRLTAAGSINNPGVYHRGSVGVSAKQLILDFGRTGHLIGAEQNKMQAQEANQAFIQMRVKFLVTQAYYTVLRAIEILKVAKETLTARQTLFERIQALRDSKIRSDLDVSIAIQGVEEGNLLVIKAQTDLNAAQAKLIQNLGLNEQKSFTFVNDIKVAPPPADIDSLLLKGKDQNPEIIMLKCELDSARQKYEAAKAENYPTINLVGYAGKNPIRDAKQLQPGYAAAGIELSVPIFTGGKITAGEKQAFYHSQAILHTLANKENQFISNVKVAWNEALAAYKNIKIAAELRDNNNKSLELIEVGYDAGRNSIVDLRQAQLSKTQADINYSNAVFEYMINLAALEFFLGLKIQAAI